MKNFKYYMGLEYPIVIKKYDKHPGWEGYIAEFPDLPGCSAYGHTRDEALKNLDEAKEVWISGVLDDGLEVPEPRGEQDFKGKILVRMPKTLHRELSLRATSENISLNQYILSLISIGLGNNQALVEIRQEIQKLEEDVRTLKEEISTSAGKSESPVQELLNNAGIDPFVGMPGRLRWVFKPAGQEILLASSSFPQWSQDLGARKKSTRLAPEGFDKKEQSEVEG